VWAAISKCAMSLNKFHHSNKIVITPYGEAQKGTVFKFCNIAVLRVYSVGVNTGL